MWANYLQAFSTWIHSKYSKKNLHQCCPILSQGIHFLAYYVWGRKRDLTPPSKHLGIKSSWYKFKYLQECIWFPYLTGISPKARISCGKSETNSPEVKNTHTHTHKQNLHFIWPLSLLYGRLLPSFYRQENRRSEKRNTCSKGASSYIKLDLQEQVSWRQASRLLVHLWDAASMKSDGIWSTVWGVQ